MVKTVGKRLIYFLLTLLLVTVLAFAAFSVIPGDPTTAVLGMEATPEQVATLRARLGLDLPVWQRYLNWLGGLLRGDLGTSYSYSMEVGKLLAPRIAVTLSLCALSVALSMALALPLGLLAARFAGSWPDRLLTVVNQLLMSVPGFLLGLGITYVFGLVLRWFSPGAYVPPAQGVWPFLGYLIFPAVAVALPRSAMIVKLLRSSVLEQLGQDYVRTAASQGASPHTVLWRHVLRNAMIPVVTFLATAVADIVAGSIVIEQVFALPGLGQMLITAIGNRDYPVVQAIVVLLATLVVVCNGLADLLYRVMDPRLR